MSAAAYYPTEKDRELVSLLAASGIPQDVMADVLSFMVKAKVGAKTLRRKFRKELDVAAHAANAKVAGALFNKAIGGNVVAMIFWLKVRAGWNEKLLLAGPTGEALDGQVADLALNGIPKLTPTERAELERLFKKMGWVDPTMKPGTPAANDTPAAAAPEVPKVAA